MSKSDEPYQHVIVESYVPDKTSGLHGKVHVRPIPGQGFPTNMHVECSRALKDPKRHPVGTKFRIKAKLTDREGKGEFLYTSFHWPYDVVE